MAAAEALAATRSVVEGAATCQSVMDLSSQCGVEMPITESIYSIIQKQKTVKEAIAALMSRQLKAE